MPFPPGVFDNYLDESNVVCTVSVPNSGNTYPFSGGLNHSYTSTGAMAVGSAGWFGYAYHIRFDFFVEASFALGGSPPPLSAPFSFSVTTLHELLNSGGTVVFRQQVVHAFTITSLSVSAPFIVEIDFDYTETVSTTIVGGTAISPGDALEYTDNECPQETDGDGVTTSGADTKVLTRNFFSAPYVMDFVPFLTVRTAFTFDPEPVDTNPVEDELILHLDGGNYTIAMRPPVVDDSVNSWWKVYPAGTYTFSSPTPFVQNGVRGGPTGTPREENVGTVVDRDGTLYGAVKDGTAVQVRHFTNGMTAPADLATIEGYKNPSMWQNGRGELFVAATESATGEYHVHRSRDFGATTERVT